jgi:p-hydroxybenzoate 3-monooxygenase
LPGHYAGDDGPLDTYAEEALARVWRAVRLSWWLTTLLHRSPTGDPFGARLKDVERAHLVASPRAQAVMAERVVGLASGAGCAT